MAIRTILGARATINENLELMRAKIHCLLLLSIGILLSFPAAAQHDTLYVSLQETVSRALESSPDLQAARARVGFAEARSRQARASRFLTELKLESAGAMVPGLTNPNNRPVDQLYLDPDVRNDYTKLRPYGQVQIELLQPIYAFGALGGNIRAAVHGVEVEEGAARAKALEVALRAADLYYNVLLTEALFDLTEQATDVVGQAMTEIERLLEDGDPEVDEADRYQVLITEQELHRRIREVTESRAIAIAALGRQLMVGDEVVALPSETTLSPLTFIPLSLEEYSALALASRPELDQARAGMHAREALIRVARAEYYPQIVFGFSSTITGASNRHRQTNPFISDGFRRSSARTGIGFRQKLNFAQTRAKVSQAEAQRDEVEYLLDAAEQLVLLEVEQAWRNLSIAEGALAAQDSSLAISKEWLRVETINFDLDLGSTENLIDAVQANLALEALHLEAVRAYNMAVLRLQRAAGILYESTNNLPR